MILHVICEISRNISMGGYIAVEGKNRLSLTDASGNEIDTHTADVLWAGSGSPFPTPPGGPWKTDYQPTHPKFRRCFFVHSDRETDIFIHFAQRKSYGCFIVNPGVAGQLFFDLLVKNREGLEVIQHQIVDNRTDREKHANPIDYSKMTKKIT